LPLFCLLAFTNGPIPGWSPTRRLSTSAVTSAKSLLCHAPLASFLLHRPKVRCIRSTSVASESMSENDFEGFANTGVNPLQTLCSSTRIRDIHKPSGACCCPARCASRLGEVGLPCNDCSRHRPSCGSGANDGHRRSKAVVRPPSPRILVAEIGSLSCLFRPKRY
jgi:hypothetical protein